MSEAVHAKPRAPRPCDASPGTAAAGRWGVFATDLFAGRHRDVLARTVDAATGYGGEEGLPCVVGSLVFMGRLAEAEAWAKRSPAAEADDDAFATFFLALGYTRHSRYGDARAAIGRLRGLAKGRPDGLAPIFLHQAIGFYRFFHGRFRMVARHAAKAAELAAFRRFQYGRYLALDLWGHALINDGEVAQGLGHLRNALALARGFGDGGSAASLEVSVTLFEARFGWGDPAALQAALALPSAAEDAYSRPSLLVESARQSLLRGRWDDAERDLYAAWALAKEHGHRRIGLWVQVLLADLALRRGECDVAEAHLGNARRELDPTVDLCLRVATLDMARKLCVARGEAVPEALWRDLEALTRREGSVLAWRRYLRARGRAADPSLAPEDRVGACLDLARVPGTAALDATARLADAGLWGLLAERWQATAGVETILVEPMPGTMLLVGRAGVALAPGKPSALIVRLLAALAAGCASHADLVKGIWDYVYHPLRHDASLYRVVMRARRALGPFAERLATTEDGYALRCAVRFCAPAVATPAPERAVADGDGDGSEAAGRAWGRMDPGDGLSPRQARLLALARQRGEIRVDACLREVGASKATLNRDLGALVAKRLLRRMGAGKATRYLYPSKEEVLPS